MAPNRMKLTGNILITMLLSTLISCGSSRTYTSKNTTRSTKNSSSTTVVKKKPIPITPHKVARADEILYEVVQRKPSLNKSTIAYIEEYNDIAILEMLTYKIPASITLAQGILESRSGQSRLTVKGNNHFGVKCHSSWTGKRIYHDDDAKQECFRKYEHPLHSFRDHSLFLYERKRYASLFDLRKKDYKGWAKGLRKAGYATDPKYPQKLIRLIEDYELYRYDDFEDDFEYGGHVVKVDREDVTEKYILVQKGDTLYSLSKKYNLTVERLKWLNGLKSNTLEIGQKLYLQ
ncbi:glucosaminidase domain-containing protein [Flavobacteriaceae bacterium F08102]|nr:glucosaminidase domain-containing protein [Flavobacteriaceae bacterium F08102]